MNDDGKTTHEKANKGERVKDDDDKKQKDKARLRWAECTGILEEDAADEKQWEKV